jgi:putative ABC transport system permease protein
VVVIDEVMARHLFPNEDPIGRQVSVGDLGQARVIGTVGHVRHLGLDSDDSAPVRDQIYFPFGQVPDEWMPSIVAGIPLMIRTAVDPFSIVSAVRTEVAGPTKDQPVYAVRTMEEVIAASLAERRFTMLLLSGFAITALALASIGTYGVISYSVGRRTHELGIRAALGATRLRVLRQVVGEGMVLAVLGLAVGVPAALALTRLLTNLLYGVQPGDPATLLAVSVTLAGVTFLASYLPARRATKVDPVVALRYE